MANEVFRKTYEVTWDQQDPIGHLRGIALLNFVVNTQFSWIAHCGCGQDRLAQSGYDPIVLRLDARYHHEVLLGETVVDILYLAGLAPDGSMWKTYHELIKADGEKVATVKLEGTWFNWKTRKAVAPRKELLEILNKLQRSSNFESMRSIIRGPGR